MSDPKEPNSSERLQDAHNKGQEDASREIYNPPNPLDLLDDVTYEEKDAYLEGQDHHNSQK